MHARTLSALAVFLVAAQAAAAELPPAGGVPDLAGPRTLALSAGVGMAAGNDGILVNPATIGARRRYSVETGGFVDRRGATSVAKLFGGSVVDSLSSPVAAGVSYLRAIDGDYTGNIVHLALAGPIAEKLYLGVAAKWLSLRANDKVSAATGDAGLFWQVGEWLSLGAVGYNLVPIANEAIAPMGVGAGLTLGNDRAFQVTADWRADLDRAETTKNRYGVGAEVLLGGLVPLRAGWARDEVIDTSWWSLGAGIVTRGGVALDVGYRQSLDATSARTIAASLKLYLFD
ncbi:hypothetical protein [Anaeromyxobacter terrae]|uniref:hypothetical protein n=1 Tax=Anaeromyxobacter terrae TaxID=2925406 RepID=UPI001F5761BE|nr:hypothetical protein [Anaeromyxobacter sp. SG22]